MLRLNPEAAWNRYPSHEKVHRIPETNDAFSKTNLGRRAWVECGETAQNQAMVYGEGQSVLSCQSLLLHPAMQSANRACTCGDNNCAVYFGET